MPYRLAGRSQEALREGREVSGGSPSVPGGAERPYWCAGKCQKALPKSQDGLEGPPGGPEEVGRLSGRARMGREALTE